MEALCPAQRNFIEDLKITLTWWQEKCYYSQGPPDVIFLY